MDRERAKFFPDVPTTGEHGYPAVISSSRCKMSVKDRHFFIKIGKAVFNFTVAPGIVPSILTPAMSLWAGGNWDLSFR